MIPLFGAILLSPDSEPQADLITAYLKLSGLGGIMANTRSWKDDKEGIRIFAKPTPALARELLDWSIEPMLYGKFSDQQKDAYLAEGSTLLWEEPLSSLFRLPLFFQKQTVCHWSVLTSNPKFDKHIALALKSFGQIVTVEGDLAQLISKLRTSPTHIVIIDWDQSNLDLKTSIPILRKLKEEKQILFLGIKNFEKDFLYRDLTYGISEISPSLFSENEIFEVIIRSLPVFPNHTKPTERVEQFRKLEFEFQEKFKPTRYKLIDSSNIQKVESNDMIAIESLVNVYRWLFGRSFQ